MPHSQAFYREVDSSHWLRTDISFRWQQYAKTFQLKICEYRKIDIKTLKPLFTAYFVITEKPQSREDFIDFIQALIKGEYYRDKKWWVNPKKLFAFIDHVYQDALRLQYEMEPFFHKKSNAELLQQFDSWNKSIMKELSAHHIQSKKNNRFQLTLDPILEKEEETPAKPLTPSEPEIIIYPKYFFIDNREKKDTNVKNASALPHKMF